MAPHSPITSAPSSPSFDLSSCISSTISSNPCALLEPSQLFHPIILAAYLLSLAITTHSAFSARGIRPSLSLLITVSYPLVIRNISLGAAVSWATGYAGEEVLGRYILPGLESGAVNILSGFAVVATILQVLYDLDFAGRVPKSKEAREGEWLGGAGTAEVIFLAAEFYMLFTEVLTPAIFWAKTGGSLFTFAREVSGMEGLEKPVNARHVGIASSVTYLSSTTLVLLVGFLAATVTHATLSLIIQHIPKSARILSQICYRFAQAVLYFFLGSVILLGYFFGVVTGSRPASYVAGFSLVVIGWALTADRMATLFAQGWEAWVLLGVGGVEGWAWRKEAKE